MKKLNKNNQELCNALETTINQYNKVVKQNRSLQKELKTAKEELQKQHIKELEEFNDIDAQGCAFYTRTADGKKCSNWRLSDDCKKNDCSYKQSHKAAREKKSFTELTKEDY